MIFLFRSIYHLFLSLIPLVEVVFLSYVFGYVCGSFPLSIMIFLFLLIATFLHSGIVKSIAWGALGFILFYVNMRSGFMSGVLFALIFAGIRYMFHMLRKRLR